LVLSLRIDLLDFLSLTRKELERLARRCRSMTCSPVIGRRVVDILQHFRLSVNSLRVYAISKLKRRDYGFIMIELEHFSTKFSSCGKICR
jgi:hypothetical protein